MQSANNISNKGIKISLMEYPNLIVQWHPTKNGKLKPGDFTKGSSKKIWWRCDREHEWEAKISHRTNGSKCPICLGRTQKQGGWKGKNGLNQALQEIADYYENHSIFPNNKDVRGGIQRALYNKYWKKYGVTRWRDLIILTMKILNFKSGDLTWKNLNEQKNHILRVPRGYWEGLDGFQRAVEEIKEFHKIFFRSPTKSDGFRGIANSANKGEWIKFGVSSWNNLLEYCGLQVNFIPDKWMGKKGLSLATKILKEYYAKHEKTPNKDDGFRSMATAANLNRWVEFGIENWSQLLQYADLIPNRERNKWMGKKGFLRAKKLALDRYKEGDKIKLKLLPAGIRYNIFEGNWQEFGITSWNSFLEHCGIEINNEWGKWTDLTGLTLAKEKIRKFVEKNDRVPYRSDLSGGLGSAANRGAWQEFGINNWIELLKACGLKPNESMYGDLWIKWESWCEKAVRIIYRESRIQPKTRLPNNTLPDFDFYDHQGCFIIGDAKTHALNSSIQEDIKNYLPYCDKLEFWCLFGNREDQLLSQKQVQYISPNNIIDRVVIEEEKKMLKKDLREIMEYNKNAMLESNLKNQETIQKTLFEFFS